MRTGHRSVLVPELFLLRRRFNQMQEKKPVVNIQNIVASAALGGEIDLESLVYKLDRIMYEPEQFPGAVYRMADPQVVFLVFSAGKLVCVGAKKEEQVYAAVDKIQKLLEEKSLIFYPENDARP